jgi:hypothetical protein
MRFDGAQQSCADALILARGMHDEPPDVARAVLLVAAHCADDCTIAHGFQVGLLLKVSLDFGQRQRRNIVIVVECRLALISYFCRARIAETPAAIAR